MATPESFHSIAKLIASSLQEWPRMVVVVSAMGDTTNQLISLAHQISPTPPPREYDMLLSVGERISMSLLAMALELIGVNAISFTGSQSGIITTDHHREARIISVKPHRIQAALLNGQVVIIAGFQGVSQKGEITTLGRGGSDTSAVALAVALEASRVEFYKNVPGIYDIDPRQHEEAQLFTTLSYQKAYDICHQGAKVLQSRAVALAWKNQLPLYIRSFLPGNDGVSTFIGPTESNLWPPLKQFEDPHGEQWIPTEPTSLPSLPSNTAGNLLQ